ncbi:MAG: efflux RND transporter permease subunit [Planctomycetota bacterium]
MTAAPEVRRGVIGLFVDRPVTTLMVFLAVLLIGGIAVARLPLRFLPQGLSDNQINVFVPVPGDMAPQEVQDKVVEPLVEMVRTIPGLERIRSEASDGRGHISVRLAEDLDPSLAAAEVRDRIQRVLPQWPAGVDRYFLWKEDGSSAPLAFVQLLTPARDPTWDHLIDEVVRPRLESVDGVGRVDVWGLRDETIKIWFDRDRLLAQQLDFRTVLQKLQSDNFAEPCGELEVGDGSRSYLVRVDSKYRSTAEIAALPLRAGLRLGDVAEIERVPEVRDRLSRHNGKYTYTAVIRAGADADPVAASDGLRRTAAAMRDDAQLAEVEVRFLFDQGQFIREGLQNLTSTALQGGLLALGVLWLFLRNLPMTIVIALSIPVTLLIAAAHLYFSGASLDICTMAGLTLAVGMVVDNAVVVLESVRRQRELDVPLRTACIRGAREVGLAVTMSTLTTVVVFLPLAFLGSRNSRVLMGAVGIPLSVALLASLLAALIFMPAGLRAIGGGSRLASAGFGRWSPLRLLLNVNAWALRHALRWRWLALLLLALTVSTIGVATSMLDFAGDDGGPFRRGDVTVHFDFPRGYDLDKAEATFLEYERYAQRHQQEWQVESVGGRFGRDGGRLDLYTGDDGDKEQALALRRKVLADWPQIPGVRLRLGEQRGDGMQGGDRDEEKADKNFVVRLWGRDAEYLLERALALQARLQQLPQVEEVEVPALQRNQEVVVQVDRDRAEELDVSPEALLRTMASGLQGRELGRFEEADREVRMVAQYDAREKPDLRDLKDTRVFTRGGAVQRLEELGAIGLRRAMNDIESENGRIHCVLVGRRADGVTARNMSEVLTGVMQRFPLARGYTWSEESPHRRTAEEIGELLRSMTLSVVAVFLLMGVLFESVILPLAILVTVPCALFGGTWSLALVHGTVDPMAIIGMVILCGIVVNNGIVLLDYIVRLQRAGMARAEAIREGVAVRMRPIFMTAATTFVGLLPMAAFGDESEGVSYVGLSIAVAGGLLASTVTTAVAVPLCYSFADDLVLWLRRLLRRRGAAA